MSIPPSDDGAAAQRMPAIFGQSHDLLAEVASRAAREAAEEHVRAGRLAPTRRPEESVPPNSADGEPS